MKRIAWSIGAYSCVQSSRRAHVVFPKNLHLRQFATSTTDTLKPSARNKNTSNNKQIRTARPPSTTATAAVTRDPRIQARPPHESADTDSSSEPKFAFPDKEKEMELSKLQVHVNDLYKRGNYRVALTEAHALLEQSRNHFGEFHPATAAAHNNVGLCHKQLGQFDQARRAYQASMKVYKQTVGSDHHSYASALHNLGTLNRSQIHLDASLKATDRLTLMDESTRVLEQAYRIRRDELGEQHPHTVASRSSWGATLAARILHSYKQVGTGQYINTVNTNTTSAVESELAWAVCEEHLRQAMDTAIANPRGPSISKKKKTNKKATNNNNKQAGTAVTNEDGIQTLSAASAAQNLAIFLKTRATTESPYNTERLDEAHRLYTECLTVRSQLLYKDHPDVYTTKYSLAELLQVKGDEEAANAIRQEILDTYDPPTASGDGAGEEAAITAVSEDFDNVQATAEDAATK